MFADSYDRLTKSDVGQVGVFLILIDHAYKVKSKNQVKSKNKKYTEISYRSQIRIYMNNSVHWELCDIDLISNDHPMSKVNR